jgi:hypothetical protein
MSTRATGTFTVMFEPLHTDEEALGRMLVNKKITGDLVGEGRAEMLSIGTPVEGSAAYVAIDQIRGTLHGRKGSFVLQHSGLMARGEGALNVVVVPDSGTDDLVGLRGDFHIENVAGEHTYVFDYDIDPT